MRIEDQRRSSNFEDRGTGRGGGSGVPIQALLSLVSLLGFKGTLLAGVMERRLRAPGDAVPRNSRGLSDRSRRRERASSRLTRRVEASTLDDQETALAARNVRSERLRLIARFLPLAAAPVRHRAA
jgi:hypothetical protein